MDGRTVDTDCPGPKFYPRLFQDFRATKVYYYWTSNSWSILEIFKISFSTWSGKMIPANWKIGEIGKRGLKLDFKNKLKINLIF